MGPDFLVCAHRSRDMRLLIPQDHGEHYALVSLGTSHVDSCVSSFVPPLSRCSVLFIIPHNYGQNLHVYSCQIMIAMRFRMSRSEKIDQSLRSQLKPYHLRFDSGANKDYLLFLSLSTERRTLNEMWPLYMCSALSLLSIRGQDPVVPHRHVINIVAYSPETLIA